MRTLGGTLGQPGQPLNVPALEQQIGRILADDTHPSTQGMDVDMGAGSLVGATMALPLDTRPKRQHDDEAGGSSSKGDPSIGPQPRPDGDDDRCARSAARCDYADHLGTDALHHTAHRMHLRDCPGTGELFY